MPINNSSPTKRKILFGGDTHKLISGPAVIAWKRRDNPRGREYLYIFPSTRGYDAVFDNKTLGIVEPLRDRDTIEVWPTSDHNEAQRLALSLIQIHNPKYNRTDKSRADGPVKCRKCGTEFKQTRFWQKDCPKCKA